MTRISAISAGVAILLAAAAPGPAFAGCAESLGLLEAQVDLVASSAALAGDRNAPLGPGRDTLITVESPEITARTRAAFDVLGAHPQASGKTDFAGALTEARSALDKARTAMQGRDEAGCEEAIALGLEAVREARAAFN
jgi:hypothetical protein